MGGGESAQAHQCAGQRRAGRALELAEQFGGARAGVDHAAAGVEHRPLGRRQQLDGASDLVLARRHARLVAVRGRGGRGRHARHRDLHVLGNIDQHRPRPPGGGDAKRLGNGRGQRVGALHEIVVLGAVARDADGVRLLEGIGSDQRGRDLAGDHHQGNRIHIGVGDAGDGVGRARAAGDEDHAGLPGRSRVALGGVRRASLVPDQDVADVRIAE